MLVIRENIKPICQVIFQWAHTVHQDTCCRYECIPSVKGYSCRGARWDYMVCVHSLNLSTQESSTRVSDSSSHTTSGCPLEASQVCRCLYYTPHLSRVHPITPNLLNALILNQCSFNIRKLITERIRLPV